MRESKDVRLAVSYFGNRYPHHAREDLTAISKIGTNVVVHVMSEADLRWNPGTIAELVAIGGELGLESWLIPWAVGAVFGGESASYAVGERPEACQRASDDRHLPALCPRQPLFRELMTNWIDAAAATGASIVQWDEPHLALPHRPESALWACRCDLCQETYRDEHGIDMPRSWTPDVATFQDRLLSDSLAWLVAAAAERGLGSSIVLLADESYDAERWRSIAHLPGVRFFGSTPFWFHYAVSTAGMPDYLRLWVIRIQQATQGSAAESVGWVQAFGVPAGREDEIETGIDLMVEVGLDTVAVWSYLACIAMSSLAAADPSATWGAVARSFARHDDRRAVNLKHHAVGCDHS